MNTVTNNDIKLSRFEYLLNNYIEIIDNLIDFALTRKLLPFKITFGMGYIKNYIKNNKIEILENGIIYLLNNKNEILNFNIDVLDELDSDNDDNISRKNYVNNIDNIKNKLSDDNKNINSNEILNFIIDIKNNSKKLDKIDINLVKQYIELLLIILEEIKLLYE